MSDEVKLINYRARRSDIEALEKVAKIYNLNKSEALRYLVKRELEDYKILNNPNVGDPLEMASQLRIGGAV